LNFVVALRMTDAAGETRKNKDRKKKLQAISP
jgi:hypothetical protein